MTARREEFPILDRIRACSPVVEPRDRHAGWQAEHAAEHARQMGGIGETRIDRRRAHQFAPGHALGGCCRADHSLKRRKVSPVDALKQRNARVRSIPRYRTSSSCVTRRIGSACIARTISAIFGGSGLDANASLARNSAVAPGSPPNERRASCSRRPFSTTANGASKGNASPLRKSASAPRSAESDAVQDPRPDNQHVACNAHALILDRNRARPSRQHQRHHIRMRREARDPDGQYRAGERRFRRQHGLHHR